MSNSAATLSAGDVVGNYRILGLIGAGGMGVVYRAFDTKLQRTVALKFLPEHLIHSSEERQRVLREARTASSLDHPNIGVIHGLEETPDGRVFIVMAFYEGETLAHRLSHGPLPVKEAVEVAIHMAEALAAAHEGAVIHRDIKPSNVILTKAGVPKIVDFGLARLSMNVDSTKSISSGGTVGYMSPEQALGKIVDQRTDIWSLGVTLTEMLTRKNPFSRDSVAGTVLAVVNEPPEIPEDLPVDVRRILYHALAKEPDARYQNCGELLADLKDVRQELDPAETPVSHRHASATQRELRHHLEQASRHIHGGPSTSQRWFFVVAVFVVFVAAVSFLPPVRERLARWSGPQETHLAVLPFENIGNDPAMEPESQGLMDSMTDQLSNLSSSQKTLWVIPSSVVRSRKIEDPLSAAKELGATLVVRGSLQKSGQAIHLNVALIDAKNLRQIGAASLEDNAGDFASLQSEAVSRLAGMMNIRVSADTLRATGGSVAPSAYESYLKALGLMQRYDKPGNLDSAIAALQSAVEADHRFALGYAQLGEAYRMKYQLDRNPKWIDEAQANCQKATEIDNRLPAAYVTLGRIHESSGKRDLAVTEFQQALQLDPRNPSALGGLAHLYENSGRIQDAEDTFRKAAVLRPDYWDGWDELGLFYDRQYKYPQAIEQLKHAAELTPDNAQVFSNLGAVYVDTADPKQFPDAEKALKRSLELTPSYPAYANLAALLYREKRYKESAELWRKALQMNDKDFHVWAYASNTYAWLNDKPSLDEAYARELPLLEKFISMHPQDAGAQANLAGLYARQKLRDKALVRIQTALALAPDDPGVLESVAVAYEALGDRRQALIFAEKTVEKGTSLDDLKSDPDLQGVVADTSFQPKGKN